MPGRIDKRWRWLNALGLLTIVEVSAGLLFALMIGLLYQFFYGKNGWDDYKKSLLDNAAKEQDIKQLVERNNLRQAEIDDLRNGTEGIEEAARLELGYTLPEETFVRIIPKNSTEK